MLSEYETLGEFQENYRYAHDYWAPFVKNAQIFSLAASGYTWTDTEIRQLIKEGREPLEFNIMRRPLQFFSGYLRDNVNSIVVAPVEGSDQKTADQFTKLQYYIWDKGGGFDTFLDACDESFKAGMSLCGLQMDYTKDFINGDIAFFKRTFNSFYLDPTFEKIDLSDCSFAITRDLLDKTLVKQLLPFIDPKAIDEIHGSFRDDKFLSYHPNFTNLSRNRNLMAYDQYYKRITKTRKFLIDERAGSYRDITDLSEDEIGRLKRGIYRVKKLQEELSDQIEPAQLEIRSVERPFVELNIMLNGKRMFCGDDKTGIVETYPFVPNICFLEPSIWLPSLRVQGIPSTLWSVQRQFNKRHMKIVDMMDSTISTGYKYLIGSISDPEELHQSGQNKIIGVDPENAPQGLDSIQELHGGSANPSLVEYQQVLDQLTLELANINESILGVDEKGNTQISGRLAQVRIAQGLRGNRKIFDNVETSQKILGGLVLKAIQSNYTPEKVKRILGEEPTEQFYEKDFEQYDAVLKEGVRSQSQRDAYYYELVNLKREGILDVPQEEIARCLPIAGGSDLREAIKVQDEKLKQQQQKVSAQEEMALKLANSQVESNLALADVRQARERGEIGLMVERISEAEQNRAKAALDRAKTITEIATMQDDRILKVLEFVTMLEQQESFDRDNVNRQVNEVVKEIETLSTQQPFQSQLKQNIDNVDNVMKEGAL